MLFRSRGACFQRIKYHTGIYTNPAYDKLISDIKASGDQGLRFKKMKEAEAMIMEDMPVVPIFHYTQPYLVKENVKGIYKELLKYPTLTYAEIN